MSFTHVGPYYGSAPYLRTPCYAGKNLYHNNNNIDIKCLPGIDSKLPLDDNVLNDISKDICNYEPNYIVFIGGIDLSIESEGYDRDDIKLPDIQSKFLHRIKTQCSNVDIILVLYGGGGIDYRSVLDDNIVDTVLWSGYAGQSGGDAIIDVITGKYNPSGRLPVTWYTNEYIEKSDISSMSFRASDRALARTYRFLDDKQYIIYPFGYGLSYTTFTSEMTSRIREYPYITLHEIADYYRDDDDIIDTLHIKVTNVGKLYGSTSVLCHIIPDRKSYADAPLKQLIAFTKVSLDVNQSTELQFNIHKKDITLYDKDGNKIIAEGKFHFQIDVLKPDSDTDYSTSHTAAVLYIRDDSDTVAVS